MSGINLTHSCVNKKVNSFPKLADYDVLVQHANQNATITAGDAGMNSWATFSGGLLYMYTQELMDTIFRSYQER